MEEVEEVTTEVVKCEKEIDAEKMPVDMENWKKNEMVDYREKIRYAVEHGILPASLIDDKINHKISEVKLDEVLARISFGRSLGITSAKLAIEKTMVVNGSMTIWGDALPAIIYQSGLMEFKEETFDATTMTAICTIKRKDMSRAETRTFSMEDAKIAGLWGKNVWAKYPKRMLQMRARTFAFRDIFPDVLQGMITTEEAMELAQQDVMNDYSKALVQPVVKHVEPVKEDVIAIDYTPLTEVQDMLQQLNTKEELLDYFAKVKTQIKTAETSQLLEMFRQRKVELSEKQ